MTTATQLHAVCFGSLTLTVNDGNLLPIPTSPSSRLVLAYLIADPPLLGRQRATIANVLWPNVELTFALRRLSQALWQLRRAWQATPLANWLHGDRQIIRLAPTPLLTSDLAAFYAVAQSLQQQLMLPATQIGALRHALHSTRAQLFPGLDGAWVTAERKTLHQQRHSLLRRLLTHDKQQGASNLVLDTACLLSESDPLDESIQRELIQLHLVRNEPAEARQVYERFLAHLAAHGRRPSELLVRTAEAIRASPSEAEAATGALDLATIPLIGRASELDQLLARLDRLLDHGDRPTGGMLLIEGEIGIGKGRLISEVLARAKWLNMLTLEYQFGPGDEYQPFHAIGAALRAQLAPLRVQQLQLAADPADLLALAAVLPDLLPDRTGTPAEPPRAADEWQRLWTIGLRILRDWSQVVPTVWVFRNLSYCDEATLALLNFAAASPLLQQSRCLLLLSYSKEAVQANSTHWEQVRALRRRPDVETITLQPLTADAHADLLRHLLGLIHAAPAFEQRLYRETQGNPLFLIETLNMLMQEGLLKRTPDGTWQLPLDDVSDNYEHLPLTPTLAQAIARRLNRLSQRERHVIDAAAVLGAKCELPLLSAIVPLSAPELAAALARLQALGFLAASAESLTFRYVPLQREVLRQLPPDTRSRLHGAAADWLSHHRPSAYATLVYHQRRAGRPQAALATTLILARRAAAVSLFQQAGQHYQDALALLAQFPAETANTARAIEFDVRVERRPVLSELGDTDALREDAQVLSNLIDHVDDPQRQIDYHLYRMAQLADSDDRYNDALAAGHAALALADQHGLVERSAYSHYRLGATYDLKDDLAAARHHLGAAERAYRALIVDATDGRTRLEARRTLCGVQYELAFVERRLGQTDAALARARALLTEAGDLQARKEQIRAYQIIGILLNDQGRAEDSLAALIEARQLAEDLHAASIVAILDGNLGSGYLRLPDYGRALDHLQRALTFHQAQQGERNISVSSGNLAAALVTIGAYEQARTLLRDAIRLARRLGIRSWLGLQLVTLANSYLLDPDSANLTLAAKYLDEAFVHAQALGTPRLLGEVQLARGRLALAQRQPAQAAAALAAALTSMTQTPLREGMIQCHLALARLAFDMDTLDAAATHVASAVALCDSSAARAAPAVSLMQHALAVRQRQPASAQAHLKEAYEIVHRHANTLTDEALHATFWHSNPICRAIARLMTERELALKPGQTVVQLPDQAAPRGRALRPDEYRTIVWTLHAPDDAAPSGKVARRRARLLRLLREAHAQGAAPTYHDLAVALDVSLRTIERDIATLRTAHPDLPPTYGNWLFGN